MLEAAGIDVTIAGRRIVDGVSLEVRPGLITVVVGPNGSGKTTLLRAISGELKPSAGRVRIDGRDLRQMKAREVAVLRAVLSQATVLAFPFTVREVVSLGIGEAGAPRGRPEEALRRVDLEGFGGRFYQDLSGGEQQRVQLARVLCQVWSPVVDGAPRYLLLDEPVSSLDIRHQLAVMRIARDFAAGGGGVLAILHDLNLAARFADVLVAMKGGGVAAAGSPASIIDDRLMETVFDCRLPVGALPPPGVPFVLPQARRDED